MHGTVGSVPEADGVPGVDRAEAAAGGRDAPTVHLVFPRLPPAPDGIGDYTACLAEALAARCSVKILTAQEAPAPIPGVAVQRAFSLEPPRGVQALLDAVAEDPPDWIVVQYNPFSYGRWGFNPHLPRTARALKRKHPSVRLAVMVHEVAPPWLNARLALMTSWQLAQLWTLGRAADVLCVAIEPWRAPFRRWFGNTPVYHLPVGSNMPYHPAPRAEARRRLGIGDPTFVVGVFGTAHPTRLMGFVRDAVAALRRETPDVLVLYVGPHGDTVRQLLGGLPLRDAGRVPPDDASRHFAAMDVCLAPFRRGVSTRRGSFLAALQQGVATVSTRGSHTGTLLRQADGQAFLLTPDDDPVAFARAACRLLHDPARRKAITGAGQALYREAFGWEVIASKLVEALGGVKRET